MYLKDRRTGLLAGPLLWSPAQGELIQTLDAKPACPPAPLQRPEPTQGSSCCATFVSVRKPPRVALAVRSARQAKWLEGRPGLQR